MNSGMSSSLSAKDIVGILIGTELNLQIVLIRIDNSNKCPTSCTWDMFPFIYVLFNFFQQYIVVFIV